MFKNLAFQSRVLLFFIGFIVLAMACASIAMFVAASRTSGQLALQQLQVADRVFQKTLDTTGQHFNDSVTAIAADYAFREAVTTHDKPTIISAVENQAARLNADVAALVDQSGTVVASTDPVFESSPPTALAETLNQARAHHSVGMVTFEGKLLQLVIVPIRAPAIVGWLCMGFSLRDGFAEEVKELSGADISIIALDRGTSRIVASTLHGTAVHELLNPKSGVVTGASTAHTSVLEGDKYLTTVVSGNHGLGDAFPVILQLPMGMVGTAMGTLGRDLLVSGGIAIVICLIAALVSARMLAEPVRALANAARSLSVSKRRTGLEISQSDDELANLAQAFHALARRAHYDALTGLPNRTLFTDRLKDSLLRAEQTTNDLAVVFIDLNGFKQINDTLGHEMGDLVLRKVGQRLSRAIVTPNTVARLGGDEFVLILEGAGQQEAFWTVNQLIKAIDAPMQSPVGPIHVGMSAGIAVYPQHATDRETLLRLADAAMYQSKMRKLGPVVARRTDPAVPKPSPSFLDSQPTRLRTGGKDAKTFVETWGSGHWERKDLKTQVTEILQADD